MSFESCENRQKILDENGHILVTGGPGSGKTTIALRKAMVRINQGILPGQSILFLSFSRAAVARIVDSASSQISKEHRSLLSIQTFHSFFWQVIKTHGYLLDCPKKLSILSPHDEKILNHGIKEKNKNWGKWLQERERLFREEGKIAFDLFSPKALDLFSKSITICKLFGECHPLIIVDEAQDTDDKQWNCVKLLASYSQLLCLADLEQQIYNFRPGVSTERINQIRDELKPLYIDFGNQNNRSPNLEIAKFGDDILHNTPKHGSYQGMSRLYFISKDLDNAIRSALKQINIIIQNKTGETPKSIAILALTNLGVNMLTESLHGNDSQKKIPHQALLDNTDFFLSCRLVAFLLEPKIDVHENINLITALKFLIDLHRAKGRKGKPKTVDQWQEVVDKFENEHIVINSEIIEILNFLLEEIQGDFFDGNPYNDWLKIIDKLSQSNNSELKSLSLSAKYLMVGDRGKNISRDLANVWSDHGQYLDARSVIEKTLSMEMLMSDQSESEGIHVMTIHKSKGKEFDGVILLDVNKTCPFIFYQDQPPYRQSRKLLRVGITRARLHTILLTNASNPSRLLKGFILDELSL